MPYKNKQLALLNRHRWDELRRDGVRKSFTSQSCKNPNCQILFIPISSMNKYCSETCQRKHKRVKIRLGDRCVRCGSTTHLTVNHIIPKIAGGTNDLSNLETLCGSCNSKIFQKLIKTALRFYFENKSL